MMKLQTMILAILLMAAPTIVFAHGNQIKAVQGSIATALEVFEDNESGSVRKQFIGVKGWVDGDALWVKILLTNQKMIAYECEIEKWEHENGEDVPVVLCEKNENFESD